MAGRGGHPHNPTALSAAPRDRSSSHDNDGEEGYGRITPPSPSSGSEDGFLGGQAQPEPVPAQPAAGPELTPAAAQAVSARSGEDATEAQAALVRGKQRPEGDGEREEAGHRGGRQQHRQQTITVRVTRHSSVITGPTRDIMRRRPTNNPFLWRPSWADVKQKWKLLHVFSVTRPADLGQEGAPEYRLLGHLCDLANEDTVATLMECLAQDEQQPAVEPLPDVQTFCGERAVCVDAGELHHYHHLLGPAHSPAAALMLECHDLENRSFSDEQVKAILDSLHLRPEIQPRDNQTVFLVTRLYQASRFRLRWADARHQPALTAARVNLPRGASAVHNADGSLSLEYEEPAMYGFDCVVLDRVVPVKGGLAVFHWHYLPLDLEPFLFPQEVVTDSARNSVIRQEQARTLAPQQIQALPPTPAREAAHDEDVVALDASGEESVGEEDGDGHMHPMRSIYPVRETSLADAANTTATSAGWLGLKTRDRLARPAHAGAGLAPTFSTQHAALEYERLDRSLHSKPPLVFSSRGGVEAFASEVRLRAHNELTDTRAAEEQALYTKSLARSFQGLDDTMFDLRLALQARAARAANPKPSPSTSTWLQQRQALAAASAKPASTVARLPARAPASADEYQVEPGPAARQVRARRRCVARRRHHQHRESGQSRGMAVQQGAFSSAHRSRAYGHTRQVAQPSYPRWFCPAHSAQEAMDGLMCGPEGAFEVHRPTMHQSEAHLYTLTYILGDSFRHTAINRGPDGEYFLASFPAVRSKGLAQLVGRYTQSPVLGCPLKSSLSPYSRLTSMVQPMLGYSLDEPQPPQPKKQQQKKKVKAKAKGTAPAPQPTARPSQPPPGSCRSNPQAPPASPRRTLEISSTRPPAEPVSSAPRGRAPMPLPTEARQARYSVRSSTHDRTYESLDDLLGDEHRATSPRRVQFARDPLPVPSNYGTVSRSDAGMLAPRAQYATPQKDGRPRLQVRGNTEVKLQSPVAAPAATTHH